jgi:hypothetical protein
MPPTTLSSRLVPQEGKGEASCGCEPHKQELGRAAVSANDFQATRIHSSAVRRVGRRGEVSSRGNPIGCR